MNQTAIFGPLFATMFLTLIVWVYMYVRRIRSINGNDLSPKNLAVPGALVLFVTNQVDATYQWTAWFGGH